MKCPKCGAEINEGASFCNYCGYPVAQANTQNVTSQTANTNNMNSVNISQNSMPNQYQNPSGMNNVPNKKKTPWGLIIGVIVLAVAIIAVFVGISMSKEDSNTNDNNEANTSENTDNNSAQEEGEETTVQYEDYTFTIPAGFSASSTSSQLLVTKNDGTIISAIIYQSGTGYDTLASRKDSVISLLESQETFQNYDFTNAVTEEKTYDGTRFLITSGVTQSTIDLDITYAEAPDGVFVVSIGKTNGTINESDRQTLYSVVASANNENF